MFQLTAWSCVYFLWVGAQFLVLFAASMFHFIPYVNFHTIPDHVNIDRDLHICLYTVKAATLILISGRCSAISSATDLPKALKRDSIYNIDVLF